MDFYEEKGVNKKSIRIRIESNIEFLFGGVLKNSVLFLTLFLLVSGCKLVQFDVSSSTKDDFLENYNFQKSDWERTAMLRNLVASSFSVAPPGNSVYVNDFPVYSSFEDYFSAFSLAKFNKTGTSCGPISHVYMNLLLVMGFKAYTYNFGIPNTMYTHELVLVEIKNDTGERSIIVQDPTYSLTIVDETDKPIDFKLFLEHVSENEIGDYHIKSDSVPSYIFLPKWGQASLDCDLKRKNELKARGFDNPDTLIYLTGFRNFWHLNSDPCGYFYDSSVDSNDKILKEQAFFRLMGSRISDMKGPDAHILQAQLDSILTAH